MKCPKCNQTIHTATLEEFNDRGLLYVAYRCPNHDCQSVISIECDKVQMENRIVERVAALLKK